MSDFVVDASAALSWTLRSQSSLASEAFIRARASSDLFLAPDIFAWEVGNVLLALHRRGSLSDRAYADALFNFEVLRIERSPAATNAEISKVAILAKEIGLSLFDAAYLALAEDRDCMLVSRDERLLDVATARRVSCVDLR